MCSHAIQDNLNFEFDHRFALFPVLYLTKSDVVHLLQQQHSVNCLVWHESCAFIITKNKLYKLYFLIYNFDFFFYFKDSMLKVNWLTCLFAVLSLSRLKTLDLNTRVDKGTFNTLYYMEISIPKKYFPEVYSINPLGEHNETL